MNQTEMELKFSKRMKECKGLWSKLGDVPIDTYGNTEEVFLNFDIGTNIYDIWHWFEDEFNVSVHDLMFDQIR